MRNAEINRETRETAVNAWLELDGSGKSDVTTGVGFMDHMLDLFAKHGRFDLVMSCDGDYQVDDHHCVEDMGIVLGKAFAAALGDRRGINRYASTMLPMDEALILTAVDISGRSHLSFDVELPAQKVGSFDTELVQEFLTGFARNAGLTLHVRMLSGTNTHHIIEGIFKSLARTMRQAAAIDREHADEIPSTKGVLDTEGAAAPAAAEAAAPGERFGLAFDEDE